MEGIYIRIANIMVNIAVDFMDDLSLQGTERRERRRTLRALRSLPCVSDRYELFDKEILRKQGNSMSSFLRLMVFQKYTTPKEEKE